MFDINGGVMGAQKMTKPSNKDAAIVSRISNLLGKEKVIGSNPIEGLHTDQYIQP
ncbi:hypothetical protein Syn7502_01360 [Synechococcus sp. PCC 7502]|nr:hypothetical protein Syn7502_01360 [Synechococcus sp. PCC 7502]